MTTEAPWAVFDNLLRRLGVEPLRQWGEVGDLIGVPVAALVRSPTR